MYLIVGLGNREPEYNKTRHNMGFDTVNKIAKKYDIEFDKKEFEAYISIVIFVWFWGRVLIVLE